MVFWCPEEHFWTSFWQLSGGLGEQIRVLGGLGDRLKFRWILVPPLGGPKLRSPGPGVVKAGPTDSLLQTGGRSQDTAYRILHATWLNFKKDAGHIGYRMQTRMQDT